MYPDKPDTPADIAAPVMALPAMIVTAPTPATWNCRRYLGRNRPPRIANPMAKPDFTAAPTQPAWRLAGRRGDTFPHTQSTPKPPTPPRIPGIRYWPTTPR